MTDLWKRMNDQRKFTMHDIGRADIPTSPGVYALYRRLTPVYVGKADVLRNRIWNNHSGRGAVMTGSALRRNIAEHLGIASAADIKTKSYLPTHANVAAVRNWLDQCEICWIECETASAALLLERDMKYEFMPMLTKR